MNITWHPIDTAPHDGRPIILANFNAKDFLTGTPHVWSARWEEEEEAWWEYSYAATNENGKPTHWIYLPGVVNTDDDDGNNRYVIEECEQENGVIVHILCKVGDTVFSIVTETSSNTYGAKSRNRVYIERTSFNLNMAHKLGKTIFLTQSEAENQLRRMGG